MAEISLDRSGIDAVVGQFEAAGSADLLPQERIQAADIRPVGEQQFRPQDQHGRAALNVPARRLLRQECSLRTEPDQERAERQRQRVSK